MDGDGDGDGGGENGCKICPCDRSAKDLPPVQVQLDTPLVAVVLLPADHPALLPALTRAETMRPARPDVHPWRVSPEGLTVFLT